MLIKTKMFQELPLENSFDGSSLEMDYGQVEQEFIYLLNRKNLDRQIEEKPNLVDSIEGRIEEALADAYQKQEESSKAHRFLQRILYHINRMKLFWYDDLENYINENSSYLASLRNRIEKEWGRWENNHLSINHLKTMDVEKTLYEWTDLDLHPKPSEEELYFRNQMTHSGYQRLLAIASLDGLVEASQLSRVLGGVANQVQATLTRLFLEEYGGGRFTRKHSTFFITMLKEFDMNFEPEAYFSLTPWEVLANINNSFRLSERKKYFLRYIGGLLYNEISVPAAFGHYKRAVERLKLSKEAGGYWELHIKEDERHGQWMLHDVAIPLIKIYKNSSWELLLGYAQQKLFSTRASRAVANSVMEADQK